jgi:uncharacterized protein (TIGR02231 family)
MFASISPQNCREQRFSCPPNGRSGHREKFMKIKLATLLLISSTFTPAFADDLKTISHIDAVTVYPQGADIVRVSSVDLKMGEHTLLLEDLPGSIDPQSIRVDGAGNVGLEITSVDSKLIELSSADLDAKRKVINDQIETLMDERSGLDQTVLDAQAQQRLLMSLADKQLQPGSTTETVKTVDATALGNLVDLVGARLTTISKSIHDAQLRQKAIDKVVADLNIKAESLAPNEAAHMQVAVHVVASAAMTGSVKVSYRIGGAGWQPFYDAKLAIPAKGEKAKLEIIRRAEVMQNTGEVWDNVAMTLSTARPSGSTAAPDLGEDPIQIALAEALGRADAESPSPVVAAPMIADEKLKQEAWSGITLQNTLKKADVAAIQRQAVVQMAGFNANYVIQGRVSVDNTGTAKKVRIATDQFDAALQAITVPRLDPNAYLTAAFTMKGDAPYLPGVVNLFRDGMFMGQGSLPQLSAGEDAKLGFGADDMIKVKRAEVKRKSGTEGIITSSNVQELAWDMSVTNLHDVTIPVTVIDRKPFSTQSDITVETLAGMTDPSVTDLNKKRGVMAWNFDLEPKAEKAIKTGYKLTSPKAANISLNE